VLPITLIVIAKNEARVIGRCLDSVPFAADKVVVDSGSTDAHARPGRFLSGGYFKLSDQISQRLTAEIIFNGHATNPEWLLANGTPRSAKLGKLRARGWHAKLMNAMTPTRPSWNGHNSSCWRTDLLKVNGHDERMACWAQDREFGERLVNAGITTYAQWQRGATEEDIQQIRHASLAGRLDS
jgi:hypothetical protein